MGLFNFFKKNEAGNSTLAETDTEKWIVGTYAMWSEYAEGDWHYFAGSKEKNRAEAASMRVMLRRDWNITDKNSLYEMLLLLTSPYAEEGACTDEDILTGAWDLCRACQILGMSFIGGYVERQEMVATSIEIGKLMQRLYHSWTELYNSYLKGYKEWRMEQDDDWWKAVTEREELCLALRNAPDGPCSPEWNLDLKL